MSAFACFKTVCSDKNDLNIDYLKTIYKDLDSLKELIHSVMDGYLVSYKIKNKKVLLKPNWVLHNKIETDELCLRTHDNFLLAALEVILEMKPAKIVIGDAPIQGCNWDKMLSFSFKENVNKLSARYGVEIILKDFRRVTYDPNTNQLTKNRNSLDNFIIFDLAEKSYLEPICDVKKSLFRVTNYDPDRLAESHQKGVHKYCITKDLFDADVVITIPKVKTHQKTGLTNALKILVGLNGDKDYLPHHRKGGTASGGDCYPGRHPLRSLSENILDLANKNVGKKIYKPLLHLSSSFWKASIPDSVHNTAAAWYGNDTTWRMVLDLNQLVVFGRADGTLADTAQRELYSLCDGIIAGQGDGPLKPDPLALGIVSFCNNAALNDIAVAKLMGMDIEKIPLLRNALDLIDITDCELIFNNEIVTKADLEKYAVKATMPPGWLKYDQQ